MSVSIERERELVEYLLGGLAPEERERVEERAFVDDEAYEELEATADDLIHAYLAGTLSPGDHRVTIKAYDKAGNLDTETKQFSIKALDAPVFTDYQQELVADELWVLPKYREMLFAHTLT